MNYVSVFLLPAAFLRLKMFLPHGASPQTALVELPWPTAGFQRVNLRWNNEKGRKRREGDERGDGTDHAPWWKEFNNCVFLFFLLTISSP